MKNKFRSNDLFLKEINESKKLLELFSEDILKNVLTIGNVSNILKHDKIAKKHEVYVFNKLKEDKEEFIKVYIKVYEEKNLFGNGYYFPKKFLRNDNLGFNIDSIAIDYILNLNTEDYSSLSILEKIAHSRNNCFEVNTQHYANKKHQEIKDKFFKENRDSLKRIEYNVVLGDKDIDYKKDNTIFIDKKFLDDNNYFKSRFIYCLHHKLLLMNKNRINLDPIVYGSFFLDLQANEGKDNYPISPLVTIIPQLLNSLYIYQAYLKKQELDLESYLTKFYNEYIVEEFGVDSFELKLFHSVNNFQLKIMSLLPMFDLTMQKIAYFLSHRTLDLDFVYFNNKPLNYSTMSSFRRKNNVYLNTNNTIYFELFNQANNQYINENEMSLYEFVKSDNYALEELDIIGKKVIKNLIDKKLIIFKEKKLYFANEAIVNVYKDIYYQGEANYNDYSIETQNQIDIEIDENNLESDSLFLSKRESDYFSYIMDVKKFSDSLALRNRYLHKGGTSAEDNESNHQLNYYYILMLFIQITLKFNLELCYLIDNHADY